MAQRVWVILSSSASSPQFNSMQWEQNRNEIQGSESKEWGEVDIRMMWEIWFDTERKDAKKDLHINFSPTDSRSYFSVIEKGGLLILLPGPIFLSFYFSCVSIENYFDQ